MAPKTRRNQGRRQMRDFILVWTFITLGMGLVTFLGIYFTYRPASVNASELNVALLPESQPVVVLPSITPEPTTAVVASPTPQPTVEEAAESQAVAQAATEAPTATDIPPTPTPLPVNDESFQVGIQVQYSLDFNPENQDGYYRSVANDLGLGWVKVQVRWENVEVAPDEYDYAKLDLAMPSAQRFGLKNMLSIVASPDWAREPGADLSRQGPPANIQDYVDFVTKVVQRYPGQVHAIEVWNEMNIDREWTSTGGLNAANYVAMLRETYNAVKAIDPGIIIISGALSPTGLDNGINAVDDFRFMDQLIAAGMLNYSDCVGAHHNGYNLPPNIRWDEGFNDPSAIFRGPFDNPHHSWSFRSTLEGYAQRIRAAGEDTPVCVTEFGWPVSEDLEGYPQGFEFAADNTLAEQAEWFPIALSQMEESGFVWLAFVWNFNYAPQAGWNPENDNVTYSLIGPNWNFRPAYDAIREWQREYRERTGQAG